MQAFMFEQEGATYVIDMTPFGESGANLGATARVELCATEMNRIQTLGAQQRYLHMRLKQRLLATYTGKDQDAPKKRFLDANPEYMESKRIRGFLDDAYKTMLYGHYPRLREAEKHAREMERLSAQTARHAQ